MHRYWSCPELASLQDGYVASTAWMAPRMKEGGIWHGYEALWARALLPQPLYEREPLKEAVETSWAWSGEPLRGVQEARAAFTDGSGGPRWTPATRPVAGAGVAVLVGDAAAGGSRVGKVAFASAPVPGRQTAPRAEAWAAAEVVRAASGAPVVIRADASYVVNGVRGPEAVQSRL